MNGKICEKMKDNDNSEAQSYAGRRETYWLVIFYVFKVGGEYMDLKIPFCMYCIIHCKVFHKE